VYHFETLWEYLEYGGPVFLSCLLLLPLGILTAFNPRNLNA
jgi:hypothetical protein